MKRILPCLFFLSLVVFIQCNTKEEPSNSINEDVVEVAIKLNGLDVTETMEPITRSGGVNTTYFFSVRQDGNPYAWYCMNSFDNVSISLVKGHTYDIIGYVAYDLKGAYYWRTQVGNGISYLQYEFSNGFEYSSSMRYHLDMPIRDYDYKMLVCSETFTSIPETIVLNMYNAYFGLKANAINLDGTLEIALGKEEGRSHAYDYSVLLTKDQPSFTDYIHFLYPLDIVDFAKSGNDYTKSVDITIKYTDPDNQTSVLHTGQISISRMKYTILDIKLADNLNNQSSCSLSMENDNCVDGTRVEFEY